MIKNDSNIRDTVSMVESQPKADINLPLAMFCTSLILLSVMLSAIVKTLF